MAGNSGFSTNAMSLKTRQQAKQVQTQRMSQQQIMSLNLLAMGSMDLRDAIFAEAEKNPALEIDRDLLSDGVSSARESSSLFSDNTRYSSVSSAAQAASDSFLSALENTSDNRQTLQDHLLHQFNAMRHSEDEKLLGQALIENLDSSGFHILAPSSLLDKNRPNQNEELLEKCIDEIHRLDPVGCCCKNVEESLFVQASVRGGGNEAALFLLDGHLTMLEDGRSEKILKKIRSHFDELKKLSFVSDSDKKWLEKWKNNPFTETDIEEAQSFIRSLDPYPARDFGSSATQYVSADILVEKIPLYESSEKMGIVTAPLSEEGAHSFKITLSRETIPRLALSRDMEDLASQGQDFAKDAVRNARIFMDSIDFRQSTLSKAAAQIVLSQIAFFEKGPRFLLPLRQKDIAEKLGVHEATISRMANSKFLQCEWGLFALSYFFTNAVGTASVSGIPVTDEKTGKSEVIPSSKEGVKAEIAQLLKEHASDKKALSDQKIADLLAQKGIKVARRTVAKYRGELNIDSSYTR